MQKEVLVKYVGHSAGVTVEYNGKRYFFSRKQREKKMPYDAFLYAIKAEMMEDKVFEIIPEVVKQESELVVIQPKEPEIQEQPKKRIFKRKTKKVRSKS